MNHSVIPLDKIFLEEFIKVIIKDLSRKYQSETEAVHEIPRTPQPAQVKLPKKEEPKPAPQKEEIKIMPEEIEEEEIIRIDDKGPKISVSEIDSPQIYHQPIGALPEVPSPPKPQARPAPPQMQMFRALQRRPTLQPSLSVKQEDQYLRVPGPAPSPNPAAGTQALEKVKRFLADPSVQSVECTGPGKPLLLNKGGRVEPTSLTMDADEINYFMKEISAKTKIPLMTGLFKAALGNIMVSAVISEFIGTRFVIQKRYNAPRGPMPPPRR